MAERTVLVVDDDAAMAEMVSRSLGRKGYACLWRVSAQEALEVARAAPPDVVVTDLRMAGLDGLALCAQLARELPEVPVVVLTAFGSLETAVGAIRAGAYDFLTKPIDLDALGLVVDRAAEHRALRAEVHRLRDALDETRQFDELVGGSPVMQRLYTLLGQIAVTDASVLITGETGTGKEVVARALHRRGSRPEGPFVAINCAAMPSALLESELFGHTRGAFTDAQRDRTGLFTRADGGTLLLDEIGEMPLDMQVKLLRALQERKVRPVGADREVPFDARIVAATNRDLETLIADGRFREDLFFRLDVIRVELPPLRARGSDVLLLAQAFLARDAARANKSIKGLSPEAAAQLLAYPWPGNVRELQNCIERAVAMTSTELLVVGDLPERVRDHVVSHVVVAADDPSALVPMDEVERRYITRVLVAVGGNKTQAARILGFDRKTLYNKLERYHLDEE